jgi:hypothetical protein
MGKKRGRRVGAYNNSDLPLDLGIALCAASITLALWNQQWCIAVAVGGLGAAMMVLRIDRGTWIDSPAADDQKVSVLLPYQDIRPLRNAYVQRFEHSHQQWPVYMQAALKPHDVRMRTRERLTPRGRSVKRELHHDLELPAGVDLVVPVGVVPKGYLQDRREVKDERGQLVGLLSYRQSTALALAAIEQVLGSHITSATQYRRLEREMFNVITAPPIQPGSGAREADQVAAGIEVIVHGLTCLIPSQSGVGLQADRHRIDLVRRLLELLRDVYLLCAHLPESASTHRQVSIKDAVLPPGVVQPRASRGPIRGALVRWGLFFRTVVRALAGTRKTPYQVDCEAAVFADSYHLEMVGPEGTFMVRQGFIDVEKRERTTSVIAEQLRAVGVYVRWTRRRGQRYGHLYLRHAFKSSEGVTVRFSFIEKPPGAFQGAALGAFATLSLIALSNQVDDDRLHLLATALVTVPVAALALSGVGVRSAMAGSDLAPRLGMFANLLIALAGAGMMLAWPGHREDIAVLATLNFVFCSYGFVARSLLYERFVRKGATESRM